MSQEKIDEKYLKEAEECMAPMRLQYDGSSEQTDTLKNIAKALMERDALHREAVRGLREAMENVKFHGNIEDGRFGKMDDKVMSIGGGITQYADYAIDLALAAFDAHPAAEGAREEK